MASFGEPAYFLLVDNEKHTADCVSCFALTTRKFGTKYELHSSNPRSLAKLGVLGIGGNWGRSRGDRRDTMRAS